MITHDIDVLARTIYGEARGEYSHSQGGLVAFMAVANVIMNRLKEPKKYGTSIAAVCQKPYQFSCWNSKDPNLSLIESMEPGENKLFDLTLEVASKVSKLQWPDITGGANHYYATSMDTPPKWALGQKCIRQIGRHKFFKL